MCFWSVLGGLGGTPGGLGLQPGRFQGPGPPKDLANFHEKPPNILGVWGGTPRGVWGRRLAESRARGLVGRSGGRAAWPVLPSCSALLPLLCFRATLTGCERRGVCWEPLFLVERPAQAARTHNPTIIHFSSVFAVTRTFCAECEGKQRARKPPLEGGWGVNPKP